jgi:hypothetical protein
MKRETIVPGRWLLPLVALGAFGMIPALWPIHGVGVFAASVLLRLTLSAVLLYFIVRFFRRNDLSGPGAH